MRITPILFFLAAFCHTGWAQPVIQLQPVANGFSNITDIAFADDDRMFVTEQAGRIKLVDSSGTVLPTPFLDITPLVKATGNEQGLLGLTFHPEYKTNGHFYINYTTHGDSTVIARYTVSAADTNLANTGSAQILMTVYQPYTNHNAGDLAFGPDGYLYFGLGDGGNGGDPQNRAQNTQTLLGKMIRIDVDGGTPYAIPPDNPFVGDTNVLDEIWSIGLRNPWRFSFDRLTGDMWIGDVGQSQWEEIDLEPASSTGGVNYGWRCYEGNHPYNTNGCQPMSAYTFPVYEYNHSNGACSVNGGFRYRGGQHGQLYGMYLFSDYCNGWIWGLEEQGPGNWIKQDLLNEENFQLVTFGEDRWGELYVGKRTKGIVYKIVDTVCQPTMDTLPQQILLSATPLTLSAVPPGGTFSGPGVTGNSFDPALAGIGTHTLYYDFQSTGGCEGRDSVTITVYKDTGILPLPDGLLAFEVYPNPATKRTQIRLALGRPAEVELQLIDVQGKLVLEQNHALPQGNNYLTLDRQRLQAGVYFLQIQMDDSVVQRSVVWQ